MKIIETTTRYRWTCDGCSDAENWTDIDHPLRNTWSSEGAHVYCPNCTVNRRKRHIDVDRLRDYVGMECEPLYMNARTLDRLLAAHVGCAKYGDPSDVDIANSPVIIDRDMRDGIIQKKAWTTQFVAYET